MKNVIMFKNLWLENLTADINTYVNKNNVELLNVGNTFKDGGYYVVFVTINTDKKLDNSIIINGR